MFKHHKDLKSLFLIAIFMHLLLVCFAQEVQYNINKDFISKYGEQSDLIGLVPLFPMDLDSIYNKKVSAKIVKLPKAIDKKKCAYGFLYFKGISNSVFKNEVVLLVQDFDSEHPSLIIDSNGNLDFTDDGGRISLSKEIKVQLQNELISSGRFSYQIGKSKIAQENISNLEKRYSRLYPQSPPIPAKYWLTKNPLSIRISYQMFEGKEISILMDDNSKDGLYTFDTSPEGDRILILEGRINKSESLASYLLNAQPIHQSSEFKLYSKSIFIKSISKDGSQLSLTSQRQRSKIDHRQDMSTFSIRLIDNEKVSFKDLIKDKRYLLIDAGGSWCPGCIKQKAMIQKIYSEKDIAILGVFYYDNRQSVRKYVGKKRIEWPVALVNMDVKQRFNITSFPTYILINSEGEIVFSDINAESVMDFLNH